jgi:hypothetical protein
MKGRLRTLEELRHHFRSTRRASHRCTLAVDGKRCTGHEASSRTERTDKESAHHHLYPTRGLRNVEILRLASVVNGSIFISVLQLWKIRGIFRVMRSLSELPADFLLNVSRSPFLKQSPGRHMLDFSAFLRVHAHASWLLGFSLRCSRNAPDFRRGSCAVTGVVQQETLTSGSTESRCLEAVVLTAYMAAAWPCGEEASPRGSSFQTPCLETTIWPREQRCTANEREDRTAAQHRVTPFGSHRSPPWLLQLTMLPLLLASCRWCRPTCFSHRRSPTWSLRTALADC